MRSRVIIEQDEDGVFIVECPSLPGCISQGKTREEAIKNIEDAIKGYIESLKAHDEPIPPSITEEVIEVVVWVSCLFCLERNYVGFLKRLDIK